MPACESEGRSSAAFGPWKAMSASSTVLSSTVTPSGACCRIQARSFSRLEALTTTKKPDEPRYTTRSSMMPPDSLHMRLYCARSFSTIPRSLVTRCCRKSTAPSPKRRNRPMCDTSNRPAAFRTAKCSSRMDVYCCGMSHPPKSTMRPPSATCRSYSGVRRGALGVKRVVDVDGVGVDELQELLVVAAPRIGHDLRDVARPVNCPLELLRDLRRGRLVTQVAAKQHLGPFVVVGRGDQELGVTHRGRFGGDRGLHLLANPVLRKLGKVALVARRESMHCFEQAQRAFLDQVEHGKPPVFAGLGEADDESQVGGHQAFLAGAVAARRLLEQVGPLGLSQQWRHPGLFAQLAQERVIAIRMDGFGSHRSILRPACGASRRPMFHVLHRHAARWVAILGACARGLRSGWSGCFLPSRPPSCRSRPRHPPRMSSRSTSRATSTTSCPPISRPGSTAPRPITPTRCSSS